LQSRLAAVLVGQTTKNLSQEGRGREWVSVILGQGHSGYGTIAFGDIDLVNLPDYRIYLKLVVDGVVTKPFSAVTMTGG
jgi:hypothetical protein